MSAPPRSVMTLPRLATVEPIDGQVSRGSSGTSSTARDVPVGPGGGRRLSQALCLARVDLPTAVCAHLQMGYGAPLLARPLGLARGLVAIARRAGDSRAARGSIRAARLELDRVCALPEGELVRELTARLESVEWPHWTARVGMVVTLGTDIALQTKERRLPPAPQGVTCPLLAARIVSATRGPVFMRDAAPALTRLLNLHGSPTPLGILELWLPVRPGTVRPPATPDAMAIATDIDSRDTNREPP